MSESRYTPILPEGWVKMPAASPEPEETPEPVVDACLYCALRRFVVFDMRGAFMWFAIAATLSFWYAYRGAYLLVGLTLILAAIQWHRAWKAHDRLAHLKAMDRRELHAPYNDENARAQRDLAIDQSIDMWHSDEVQTDVGLPEWLGWTEDEYAHWVETREVPNAEYVDA